MSTDQTRRSFSIFTRAKSSLYVDSRMVAVKRVDVGPDELAFRELHANHVAARGKCPFIVKFKDHEVHAGMHVCDVILGTAAGFFEQSRDAVIAV